MSSFTIQSRPGTCSFRRLAGLVAAGCGLVLGQANGRTAELSATHDLSGNLTLIAAKSGQAPLVISSSWNAVAPVAGVATFSVTASGSPVLGYQWFFNNSAIVGATGDSLLITNVSPTDFGSYYAVVANAFGSVTSSVARLELDADRDGLADSWEIAYFGSITNQSGASDKDHDGTANLMEYLDGTNPTNALSVQPRLTVAAYRCVVSINPDQEKYTNGQPVTLTAIPDAGLTTIFWSGATNSTSNVVTLLMTTNKAIAAQGGLPVAESLDVTNRVLTGGDVSWYGQSEDTHDGLDAARSGRMTNSQTSWFQMTNTMTAEGTVTFWWKVSSQANYDYLKVLINGAQQPGQISGVADWQQKSYYVTSGVSVVRWEFTKNSTDGQVSDGITLNSDGTRTIFYAAGPYPGIAPLDAAWVDQVTFIPYTNLLLDTDGDGLPDLWEYRYFYSLDPTATGDPDGDGNSNLEEYLNGTNPTINSSSKHKLTLLSEGAGTVSSSPNKLKYNYGETVTNSAVPATSNFFVMWTGAIFNSNLNTTVSMTSDQTVKGVFGFALDQALDTSGLSWTRGGVVGWYGQTNVTHDGADAAQSAPITSGGESWMETTVTGPGGLSFWWKVSCLTNSNTLRLNVNGVEQSYRISGEVDWQPQFFYFGPGTNTFRWRFFRNNYSTNFLDAGWVDQVIFTPGDIPPSLLLQPGNLSVLQGSNVTLTAFAAGTPTLTYEWQRNGVSLSPPSTNTSFTITNISAAQGGSGYSVRVSNAGGVATNSVPFAITVLPVPPVNDNFSSRLAIAAPNNTASGYNFGASRETGEPSHANFGGSRSVWWSWVAPQSGMFRLHASSQGISSLLLGVYTGAAVNSLTPVAADQSYGTSSNGVYYAESEVFFHALSNTAYAIAADSASGNEGWIQLALTDVPSPGNDSFAGRFPLQGFNVTATGYNIGATAEPGEPSHSGSGSPSNSVWWTWSPPGSGIARLNSQGTTFTAAIAIYTGNTIAGLSQVASTFATPQIDFPVVGGVPYSIAFDGISGGLGDIKFSLGLLNPVINTPAQRASGAIEFTFSGWPGAAYVIQTSTNLSTWSSVATNKFSSSGTTTFTNSLPVLDSKRFYRILAQ